MKINLSHKVNNQAVVEIELDSILGRGGTAFVYKIKIGNKYYAAKIYHQSHEANDAKLLYMINNPPVPMYFDENNSEYPLYSWPLALAYKTGENYTPFLSFDFNAFLKSDSSQQSKPIGFISPLVDEDKSKTLDYFYDYTLSKRLQTTYNDSLSFKIKILSNLAKSISYLHQNGVYIVDIKPQNIRVFEGTNIVSIIDCDSFNISRGDNQITYKADMISPGYIAPEFLNTDLSSISFGEDQDTYAFAVIIFQLLNKGIHPFQGIINDPNIFANTNDEKAAAGLYAYGVVKNNNILPKKESLHQYFLPATRLLFDRAFIPGKQRPTAQEWFNHFDSILHSKDIVRCKVYPSETSHMHFRGMPCPVCANSNKASKPSLTEESILIPEISQLEKISTFKDIQHMYATAASAKTKSSILPIIILCIVIFGGLFAAIISMDQTSKISSSNRSYQPSQNQYSPSTTNYDDEITPQKSSKSHVKTRKKEQHPRQKNK